jgi:hypothetical protein
MRSDNLVATSRASAPAFELASIACEGASCATTSVMPLKSVTAGELASADVARIRARAFLAGIVHGLPVSDAHVQDGLAQV